MDTIAKETNTHKANAKQRAAARERMREMMTEAGRRHGIYGILPKNFAWSKGDSKDWK